MKDYSYLQQKYLVNTYQNRSLTLKKGKGIYLYDSFGEKFLDMMTNYGVNIFGHNHPLILKELTNNLKKLPILHCSFANKIRAMAAEQLILRSGGGLAQIYFANSGTEAVEAALKFAVLAKRKKEFIACENGYHGKTLGSLSATFGEKYKKQFQPLLWKFKHIPFNNIQALKKAISEKTAAFIVEPIQGEAGIIIPSKGYLQKVREVCDKNKILLILDEIQTGGGRTGYFLASNEEKINYDIVCLGKGLGGGIPFGATLVNKEISQSIPKAIHSSTFGGNPLACSGVLAVLKLLDKKRLIYIRKTGEYFITKLKTIKSKLIKEVRGKGLIIGIETNNKDRDNILRLLQLKKILAAPAGENVIRFLPPYIITKKEIDFVVETLRTILNSNVSLFISKI